MYSLNHEKNGIYTILVIYISFSLYSEVYRSSPDPATIFGTIYIVKSAI